MRFEVVMLSTDLFKNVFFLAIFHLTIHFTIVSVKSSHLLLPRREFSQVELCDGQNTASPQ